MIGTVLAVAVVFAILFILVQSLGYYRANLSVADTATTRSSDVRRSAAVGAGGGVIVLFLLGLLYLGVTRWDWFGNPAPKPAVVSVPAKETPPPVLGGVGATPSAQPGGASPAASPSK